MKLGIPTRRMTVVSVAVISMAVVMTTTKTTTVSAAFTARGPRRATSFHSRLVPFSRVTPPTTTTQLYYDVSGDPPSSGGAGDGSKRRPPDAWTVLANTERWISETLTNVNRAANGVMNAGASTTTSSNANSNANSNNPYARKEVSYVCESQSEQALIVANVFKRLRQAREQGEEHGRQEIRRQTEQGSSYHPSTMRQTQVIVIPSNDDLMESFFVFNELMERIQQARRNARDYILSGPQRRSVDDWSVAVSVAHLHPRFGEKTPEQVLQEMKEEEAAGEVDVNYQNFLQQRMAARRSPYPSLVLEVRATPPMDFGETPLPTPQSSSSSSSSSSRLRKLSSNDDDEDDDEEDEDVEDSSPITSADIQKLEALFGKQAHMSSNEKSSEDELFQALVQHTDIPVVDAIPPLEQAQEYMSARHGHVIPPTTAFTESSAVEPDEAFEFVFTNICMMTQSSMPSKSFCLVFPNFVTGSATSLEQFSKQVLQISQALPDLRDKITVRTFHPEHLDSSHRSPVPILSLEYHDASTTPHSS